MNTKTYAVGVVVAWVVFASNLAAQPPQQDYRVSPVAAPAESVLLLQNGQVLRGEISRKGGDYLVVSPGIQLLVREHQVEMHCQSLEEVYRHRRSRMDLQSAQSHLEMAQWCLKHQMLPAAKQELFDAVSLDRRHPLIPVIERRLELAESPPATILPASADSKPLVAAGPSSDELDRIVRGMPPKTMEMFTAKIQPILLSNCATAACHGQPGGQGFQLSRIPSSSRTSPGLTQRNLYATLPWIDQEDPSASPLLNVPLKAHGTARGPVFTKQHESQYRQLVEWCHRMAPSPVLAASHQEPVVPKKPQRQTRPAAERGVSMPPSRPADPFDPEAFNRQFAPKREPQSEPSEQREEPANRPIERP